MLGMSPEHPEATRWEQSNQRGKKQKPKWTSHRGQDPGAWMVQEARPAWRAAPVRKVALILCWAQQTGDLHRGEKPGKSLWGKGEAG